MILTIDPTSTYTKTAFKHHEGRLGSVLAVRVSLVNFRHPKKVIYLISTFPGI